MTAIEPKKFYVKPEHLTGAIADFPLHIVQLMVDEQARQGNPADPRVFVAAVDAVDAVYAVGGFSWENSFFGRSIWEAIINDKKFYLVPEPKYPCTTTEKPKGHVHAQLMKSYAEDAATHEKPWELWEFRVNDWGKGIGFQPCDKHPAWLTETQYRRKSDAQVEPTPNEIVRAMLDKGMTVWGSCSDYSYQNARDVAKVQLSKIVKDSSGGIKNAEGKCWKYVVPIDPKTMTEITELPK